VPDAEGIVPSARISADAGNDEEVILFIQRRRIMPRGDGTGPAGIGPMTGRAAGYCAGYAMPGYANPYGGRLGRGMAWGRGRRFGYAQPAPYWYGADAPYRYAAPYSKTQEREALQNHLKLMEEQVSAMRKRLEELESESLKED
jgi:hypothetical protein